MNIYFGGDSYVAGDELDNPETQGFAYKLAHKLNATFINQAEGGSSNSLILRKIEKFLYQCKQTNTFPDLIVIGWSEASREDWFMNGDYRSVAGTGPHLESFDLTSHQYWTKYMNENQEYWHQMSKFYNRSIYNISQQLKYLKIPHVFFNAITPLNPTEHYDPVRYQHDPILKLNWGDCFFNPYDTLTWRDWAVKNQYKEITPGKFHYEEAAHTGWAEVIYNYIKEKNIK